MPVRVADLIRSIEADAEVGARAGAAPARRRRAHLAWLDPGRLLAEWTAMAVADAVSAARPSAFSLAADATAEVSSLAVAGNEIALAADSLKSASVVLEVAAAWRTGPELAAASPLDLDRASRAALAAGSADLILAAAGPTAATVAGWDPGLAHWAPPVPSLGSVAIARVGSAERAAEAVLAADLLAASIGTLDWSAGLGPDLAVVAMPRWDPVLELPPLPWLAPGTRDADLFLLLRGDGEPEEPLAALERMVDRVPWAPRGAARDALYARARDEEASPAEIKRRELRAAVVLVLGAAETPQYHRFGTRWLVGRDGRKDLVRPYHDLDLDLLWEWFCDEVPKAAEAALLERPYPATGDPLEPDKDDPGRVVPIENLALVDPAGDPLLLLLERERRSGDAARLLTALRLASPRQRELLSLIRAGDSPTEAGRRLGMAPGTARAQLYRLRQKLV